MAFIVISPNLSNYIESVNEYWMPDPCCSSFFNSFYFFSFLLNAFFLGHLYQFNFKYLLCILFSPAIFKLLKKMKGTQKKLWCTLIESCHGYWSVNLQNFQGSFYNEILTMFLVNLMANVSPGIIYNSVFNLVFILFKTQYRVNKQHCQISETNTLYYKCTGEDGQFLWKLVKIFHIFSWRTTVRVRKIA